MNERIQALINQATTKKAHYPAGCNGYPDYLFDFDKEKFAELIIQECVLQCVHDEDMDLIKQHFGVHP